MKRATTLIDRVLVLALGFALLAAGALGIGWFYGVPLALDVLPRFDRDEFLSYPLQPWWTAALAVTAAIGVLVASALLVGNLSPRHTRTLLVSSGESLAVRIELDALARGVAAELESVPGVESARGRAIDDRGTATLAVTVHAAADLDVAAFTELVDERAAYVADAVAGRSVAVRVQLHL